MLGQRDGVPRKPDATGAEQITRELETAPEDFILLGDTPTDMETARRAGMRPVGVRWGFRPAEELEAAGAMGLIERPIDLLEIVEGG